MTNSSTLTTESSSQTIVITPNRGARHYWNDLWNYRELFYFLAWRDILVRYKQTTIGVAWAVIRPFLTMVVFTIVFGSIAKLPSQGGAPYAILVFAALLPWQFFSTALTDASNSLLANASMLTKIYFPRLIIPTSTVIVGIVDFLISLAILAGLMVWYQFVPDWKIITVPLFFLIAFVITVGAGIWLAAINVRYRDFRFIVPFILQFGLFITPVGFSSSVVPDQWRLLYSLNPMVGVIDGFRWAIIGGNLDWSSIIVSMSVALFLIIIGIWYFRKVENTFADII